MGSTTIEKDILAKIENTMTVDCLKKLNTLIKKTCGDDNQLTNLLILACKYNKLKVLEYLFNSDYITSSNLQFHNEDETNHNAFYYAIRSGNVEILDTLINNYPTNQSEHLDEILSTAYDELKLKNIPLSDEIIIAIEKQLINLRFFSEKPLKNVENSQKNILNRIDLVLENITLLNVEYSNEKNKLDERFLFISKFIVQNIYILKRQLKSTYNVLPWEEIEFCLITFISSNIKEEEINLFCRTSLDLIKILNHLVNFAKKLQSEQIKIKTMEIYKLAELPKLHRDKVIQNIIRNNPEFETLYNDYKNIRDIHSLIKINDYTELALSADPKEREGQLIITRVLQVIGEYVKNTLESPKLSNTMNELLLLTLPANTRKIIINLRNSLSHASALSNRTEIDENKDIQFFIHVQNDVNKIGIVIRDILYRKRIKLLVILLNNIINNDNVNTFLDYIKVFKNVPIQEIIKQNSNLLEYDRIDKLTQELSNLITEKTNLEKVQFSKIYEIIKFEKSKFNEININYIHGISILKSFSFINIFTNPNDTNWMFSVKETARIALKNIEPKLKSYNIKEIIELLFDIRNLTAFRIESAKLNKYNQLFYEILFILQFEADNIKWIEELKENLNEKTFFNNIYEENQKLLPTNYNIQLKDKLSELKNILNKNVNYLISYKNNQKLQAIVEMLLLDIMSILGITQNALENNLLFLDDNSPLISGKSLRNHLAHQNLLIDIISTIPSISIILNAKKLITEDILKNRKKIGKILNDNLLILKTKYNRGLDIISNQEKMFIALQEGNLDNLKDCIKQGADIQGRTSNLSTTLHYASKSSNLEIVKFLILQHNISVKAKDINNQSPLHISAAYGRTNICEYFLKDTNLNVNLCDDFKNIPLHLAAERGHKETVEILLKYNSKTICPNMEGLSPIHCATKNNKKECVEILLKKELNANSNETLGGYTLLHIATECGFLQLTEFLLENNANVDAKNDRGGIPLHAAALHGHLDVVNALILNGSDVNASVIDGCTVLHYAAEHGHTEVIELLLKHGANVNAFDKTYHNRPLHYVAKDGHDNIVKIFLDNKADANAPTIEGLTPLHLAAMSGNLEIAKHLLKHNVNIDFKDKNGGTPLHYAVENVYKDFVEFLIENKAKINTKRYNKSTPLHLAASIGNKDIIEILINNKAYINAEDINGNTALHLAAGNGNKDVIEILLKNKSLIHAKNCDGLMPLHIAAIAGYKDALKILIENNADVNCKSNDELTPLHSAVLYGQKDCTEILLKNQANVNAVSKEHAPPIFSAIRRCNKDIVKMLIAYGANVNFDFHKHFPLHVAINSNYKEMVEILIKNGANVKIDNILECTVYAGFRDILDILLENNALPYEKDSGKILELLILAAERGHKAIVTDLLARGFNVKNLNKPLYYATIRGHSEIVKILLLAGAQVNNILCEGTSLHLAAGSGFYNIIEILLNNGANINLKDEKNRRPIELAVAYGHFEVVKLLLKQKEMNINAKSNDNWTMLHIAAQSGNLEIIKLLVDNGIDINAKNNLGSMAIHIAAREGFTKIVEYFLTKGFNIDICGAANQTPLHYSAIEDRLEVAEYLIKQGANINIKDINGQTPMHIAAMHSGKDFVELLLKNGAIYNIVDKQKQKPINVSNNKAITHLLNLIDKLFDAVKGNQSSEVKTCIKSGVYLNAKNIDHYTPLHYGAWKGYDEIINILLQNKANPNEVCKNDITPLHYAAKFSHLKVTQLLLANGAIYNATSDKGKTPSDLTTDKTINNLLNTINESFNDVKNNNSRVVAKLTKINDIDTLKIIMNTHNKENQTLTTAAMKSNFSQIDQLNALLQGDISIEILQGQLLAQEGNYNDSLSIFRCAFEKRKSILGSDNPATLDIQTWICRMLYKQGLYVEALSTLKEILAKQTKILGLNDKATLSTRSIIAAALNRQGKYDEAIIIYREIVQKQTEILGPDHLDTLSTECDMALALDGLKQYEEALSINRKVFQKKKALLGPNDPNVVSAQNNIALVLGNQGNYEEASKVYNEVYEKKKRIFGINHPDTLNTLCSIGTIYHRQDKYQESIQTLQNALNGQKIALGPNHPSTLMTEYNIAIVYLIQRKWIAALKAFQDCHNKMKTVYEPNHPAVLAIQKKIKSINVILQMGGTDGTEMLNHLENNTFGVVPDQDINTAASNGDIKTVEYLLENGINANCTDIEGRTPLHFAVNNGRIGVVKHLLANGADITQVTNKGNTPLHTAVLKNYKAIIEVLLQHVKQKNLNNILNAKTTVRGNAAIHIAAKNDNLDIIKLLLKHGAIYDITNTEGNTPNDLSKDKDVNNLLKLINNLFENNNRKVMKKLKSSNSDDISAITNARNRKNNTILQAAIINKNKDFASEILQAINMITKMNIDEPLPVTIETPNDIKLAAGKGNIEAVKYLLKNGKNPNDKDTEGRTPLHFAANNGHLSVVKYLLENGADITKITNKGNTPLHTATAKDNVEIVEILLKNARQRNFNDFINAKTTTSGTTALHIAVKNGFIFSTKLLLERGAIFNIQNIEGKTPLDLSNDKYTKKLLEFIDDIFKDAQCRNIVVIDKLKLVDLNDFAAITSTRNHQGATLMQLIK